MSEYVNTVDKMSAVEQGVLFEFHDAVGESESYKEAETTAEGCENPPVLYPQTMAELQTLLRRRHSGRAVLNRGDGTSDDEVTAHEDMGGGVHALRKTFSLPPNESLPDRLIRTHHMLPGDDIQDGIDRLGLYQLMQTGIDAMTNDDKKTLARHYEPYHDILMYRPRAILLNDGDHPVLMNKYGNASQDELKQYADDVITFRNCLLNSGLTERLFNILGYKGASDSYGKREARKRYTIKRDLVEKGPIQVVFTTSTDGRVKPVIVRI